MLIAGTSDLKYLLSKLTMTGSESMVPSKKYIPYLFIFPSLVLILIFSYYAVGYSIYASFTNLKLGYKTKFIGFDNYIRLFGDPVFIKALSNQLILLVSDIVKYTFFPLLAAELLYFVRSPRISGALKRLFIFPMLVPAMVIFLMFANILNPSMGALNAILELIGLENLQHNWLGDSTTALGSIIFIGFPYVSGLYFLIFHAGLNNIPKELIESAQIDGCTSVQIIKYIHVPLVGTYIGTSTMLIIIASLQDYVKILVTTGGGPNGFATYTPAVMLYKKAFEAGKMGYASSVGVVMFIVIMILTILSFKVTQKREENNQ